MKLHFTDEGLRRRIEQDGDPEGCIYCGAMAGACKDYPNCPNGPTQGEKQMSYSFSVKARNRAEATAAVAAELDKVVTSQPIHTVDKEQALAAATAFISLFVNHDSEKVLLVNVSGSLSWSGGPYPDHDLTGANVSVSASLVKREETVAA